MSKCKFRTIIILSSPRSGSVLLYEILKPLSPNSDHLFNLNFWGLALNAIKGDDKLFRDRLRQKFPFIQIPKKIDDNSIFDIWNKIGEVDGPLLIDKSPFYLDNYEILELLLKYNNKYENVDFISFIRHPLDAITSQEENGKYRLGYLNITDREQFLLKRFNNLEKINLLIHSILIIRYEDLIQKTYSTIERINKELKLDEINHMRQSKLKIYGSMGRYNFSFNRKVRNWKISADTAELIKKYDYNLKPKTLKKRFLYIVFSSFIREILAQYYTLSFRLFKIKR